LLRRKPHPWRFMLWGGVGAGKTTLLQALQGGRGVCKTQMIEHLGQAIDTPGEYSEMGRMRQHLQTTAAEVQVLVVLQDASRDCSNFPPNYFLMFRQPVLGVVTKIDVPAAQPERARGILRQSGVKNDVYCVSAFTGAGLKELAQALNERRIEWETVAVAEKPLA
jgi:ethanolamine utilization protein EutP